MPVVKTRPEAAAILEVTVKSIGDWKLQPGFPNCDHGYDTDAIQVWRDATKVTRDKSTALVEQVNLKTKAVKLQILELKRQSDEMELEKARMNLMPRELVKELLAILTGRIRDVTNNLQQSGKMAEAKQIIAQLDLAKRQINDRIDAAIRDAAK